MYTILSLAAILAFVAGVGSLSWKFLGLAGRVVTWLHGRAFGHRTDVAFIPPGAKSPDPWIRVWSAASIVFFLLLGFHHGAVLKNAPSSLLHVAIYGLAATCMSGVLLLIVMACAAYLPRGRGETALGRHGLSALWMVNFQERPSKLCDEIASRVLNSSRLLIVDVTGYEVIGKGPGSSGGLLYDTLAALTSVPVHLLLLEPETKAPDPEQRRATVYQTLLAELEVTPATYERRLRATLDAVATLNEARPPETKILVRYYAEKPSCCGLLMDECLFAMPCVPRETSEPLPFLEVTRRTAGASFYEGFRRQFARLWAGSTSPDKSEPPPKPLSAVIRRQAPAVAVEK